MLLIRAIRRRGQHDQVASNRGCGILDFSVNIELYDLKETPLCALIKKRLILTNLSIISSK
jgi:hypothetical protein